MHYSDITWPQWYLKLPLTQLFVQHLIRASIWSTKKTSKLCTTGSFMEWIHQWFSSQWLRNAQNCFHATTSSWSMQLHQAICWFDDATTCVINSTPPNAAYMYQWIGSTLVQIMACCLFGTKPLSKQMLGYCELDPRGTNFSEILIKIQNFSFTKMHLKISSVKRRPFCPGEMD